MNHSIEWKNSINNRVRSQAIKQQAIKQRAEILLEDYPESRNYTPLEFTFLYWRVYSETNSNAMYFALLSIIEECNGLDNISKSGFLENPWSIARQRQIIQNEEKRLEPDSETKLFREERSKAIQEYYSKGSPYAPDNNSTLNTDFSSSSTSMTVESNKVKEIQIEDVFSLEIPSIVSFTATIASTIEKSVKLKNTGEMKNLLEVRFISQDNMNAAPPLTIWESKYNSWESERKKYYPNRKIRVESITVERNGKYVNFRRTSDTRIAFLDAAEGGSPSC